MILLKEIFRNESLSIADTRFSFFDYFILQLLLLFYLIVFVELHHFMQISCYHLCVDALILEHLFFGVKQIVQSVCGFRLHWTANAKHVILQVLTHFTIGRAFWRELCTKIIGSFKWFDNCENKKRRPFRSNCQNSIRWTEILFVPRNTVCKSTCWTITIPSKIYQFVCHIFTKFSNELETFDSMNHSQNER